MAKEKKCSKCIFYKHNPNGMKYLFNIHNCTNEDVINEKVKIYKPHKGYQLPVTHVHTNSWCEKYIEKE